MAIEVRAHVYRDRLAAGRHGKLSLQRIIITPPEKNLIHSSPESIWGMIYGEVKQTCGSARMDCAGGERTKATFQKQKPRYNDLQGTEAHAWCLKTKGA